MASSSRHSKLTIQDLPDDLLEHVFVLAGQRYYPAIVGVSKRWRRVCWGSRQLWRHLDLRCYAPDDPIATAAAANPPPSFEERKQREQWREAGCRAAKRAQLERVGGWAESVTYDDSMAEVLPVPAMLRMLSAEAMAGLALYIGEFPAEQAQQLAGFTRLTSLDIPAPEGCDIGSILRQLPRLQHLTLRAFQMDEQLVATLLPLIGLTRLDLSAAILPSLVGLSGLQRLHHFSVIVWDGEWPAGDATLLPVPASCAALQSYSAIGAYVYGGLELEGLRFQKLAFKPLPSAGDGASAADASSAEDQPDACQPGSLLIDGVILDPEAYAHAANHLNANGGNADAQQAPAAPAQPPMPLNSLLEGALPPHYSLRQLELAGCVLHVAALQHLPAIARLESLTVRRCWAAGGMAAPLQALVQRAPALTSLCFDLQWLGTEIRLANRLPSWPAYLLAHPCLRSVTLLSGGDAEWDAEQALLPTTATAKPVLEHLTTDGFASVPPQLAAVTSLRSLDFTKQPQFQLKAGALDTLLALPHLTSLKLPRLSWVERLLVVTRLRRARPGLNVQLASA